jgi:hypothetical protein
MCPVCSWRVVDQSTAGGQAGSVVIEDDVCNAAGDGLL